MESVVAHRFDKYYIDGNLCDLIIQRLKISKSYD
jgi:hypothetical protein